MPRYRPKELHSWLHSLGIRADKRLSQNFLIDGNIIGKILQLAEIEPKDKVLEIGPGPGALTEALFSAGAEVTAVEKDIVLAEELARQFPVEVIEGDILKVDLKSFSSMKVVANLPYNITSLVLTKLLPRNECFKSITVMVQEEVARRLTAKPKTKDYSSLTVFTALYSDPLYGFKVSRNCFYPAPNVDSAVVQMKLKEPPPIDLDAFHQLVRTAFGKRRKMLTTSLKEKFEKSIVAKALLSLGLPETARPEELGIMQWVALLGKL